MEFRYQVGDDLFAVDVEPAGDGYRVTVNGRVYQVQVLPSDAGQVSLRVGGRRVRAHVAVDGPRRWVAVLGHSFVALRPEATARPGLRRPSEDLLTAAMPGQVRAVPVAEGQAVDRGQTLIILEAMKMEIRVSAPQAGRVTRLLVREGQVVERGQKLVELSH